MATILTILLIPVATNAAMFDDWDTTDIILGATWTYLTLELDRRQTITIGKDDNGFYEDHFITKGVIGKKPSKGEVNTYFIATWVLNMLIADNLESEARKFWLTTLSFSSWQCVDGNRRIGVKMSARF